MGMTESGTARDRIDRECFIARSGRPHNPAIAHLMHVDRDLLGAVLKQGLAGKGPGRQRQFEAATFD